MKKNYAPALSYGLIMVDSPEWIAHQRKRWMQPDAGRYLRPDWRDRKYWNGPAPPDCVAHPLDWTPQAQAEFIRNCGAGLSAADAAELADMRRELTELKALVEQRRAALCAQASQRKYSPDQPRVPAGSTDGGQWTSEGGGAGTGRSSESTGSNDEDANEGSNEPATDVSAARRKALETRCLAQYARDTFYCTMIGSRPCHAQAAERLAACLTRKPLPPLNF